MGKTKCLGCGKSLGGVFDGFGTRVIYGQLCLTCNKTLQGIPNYQSLTPDQMKAYIEKGTIPEAAAAKPAVSSAGSSLSSVSDEIRSAKQMLDEGLITQEEFDLLKKRLLNI